MATLIVGECLGVTTRKAGPRNDPAKQWDETVVVVLDGMHTDQVPIASVDKFRGAVPTAGEIVALEVGVRAYSGKNGIGYQYTAFGRSTRVEQVMAAATAEV